MTIQRSEQLNELFGALSKLQGKLDNAKKDKSGYLNRYKYADLAQYIEVSKELLEENGLCILQIPETIEIVEVTKEVVNKKDESLSIHSIRVPKQKITTYIGHCSGQFISGTMEILVERSAGYSWGQSTGSAISFARRYALAGTLGMSQEDDDNQMRKNDANKKTTSPDPLVIQLINLIKSSGCDIDSFAKFHNISDKNISTVKNAIDNFDKLLINFRNSRVSDNGKEIQNTE